MITQYKEVLTLCEVEVMVPESDAHFPYVNIAVNGTATQSSDFRDRRASRAIDGTRTGILDKGSCSMTRALSVNKWKLWLPGGELGAKYPVNNVLIFNRRDCCGERLDDAEVWLDDELCGRVVYQEDKILYNVPCNLTGGRITILKEGTALTLCEVEVYVRAEDSAPEPLVNVAPGGAAHQTSTRAGGVANRAIDGQTTTHWNQGSCSNTQPGNNSRWTVDLAGSEVGVQYKVERVVIYNRADDKQDRIDGVRVWVGSEECGEITYRAGQKIYFVECGGKSGSTVSLTQDKGEGILTLCEVQVVVKSRNIPHIPTYTNVALGREASQGHNRESNARRAVDGNTSGKYGSNSCTYSQNDSGNSTWWRVELDQDTAVRSVVVINRVDNYSERIDGVQVSEVHTLLY